jgi:hypothetical protein
MAEVLMLAWVIMTSLLAANRLAFPANTTTASSKVNKFFATARFMGHLPGLLSK